MTKTRSRLAWGRKRGSEVLLDVFVAKSACVRELTLLPIVQENLGQCRRYGHVLDPHLDVLNVPMSPGV